MKIADEVRRRVAKLVELSDDMKLAPPATEAQIAKCEKELGMKLPPSYRAFLLLHDGATGVLEYDRLFGTKDFGSDWFEEQKEYWLDVDWDEEIFESSVPFLMAEAGSGVENFFAFAPPKPGKDVELEVIDWDNGGEGERIDDFLTLLDEQISLAEDGDGEDDDEDSDEDSDDDE